MCKAHEGTERRIDNLEEALEHDDAALRGILWEPCLFSCAYPEVQGRNTRLVDAPGRRK